MMNAKPFFQDQFTKNNGSKFSIARQNIKKIMKECSKNPVHEKPFENDLASQKIRHIKYSEIIDNNQDKNSKIKALIEEKLSSPKQASFLNKKNNNYYTKSYQSIGSSPNKYNFQDFNFPHQQKKRLDQQPMVIQFRKSGNIQRNQISYGGQKTDRLPRASQFQKGYNLQSKQSQIRTKKQIIEDLKYKKKQNIIKPNSLKETSSTLGTVTISSKKSQQFLFKNQTHKIAYQTQNNFSVIHKNLNPIRLQDFKILKQIGKGKFGNVFIVKHKLTGFVAALKIIKKKQIIQQKLVNQLVRQLKIHAYLNHPNIINFYGSFQDKQNVYILLELGSQGQLYTKLKKKQSYSQQATAFIIKNLLEAVKYMHSKKLIHRDIKPENIVVVHGIVKLCDFGWAVYRGKELRTTFCGTPLYVSPELLQGQSYDEKVDLWAVGILAYQLLIGDIPFEINTEQQLSKIITQDIVFPKNLELSEECKDFILKILNKNPKQRGLAQQLLKHPFIQKYSEFQTCQQLCEE